MQPQCARSLGGGEHPLSQERFRLGGLMTLRCMPKHHNCHDRRHRAVLRGGLYFVLPVHFPETESDDRVITCPTAARSNWISFRATRSSLNPSDTKTSGELSSNSFAYGLTNPRQLFAKKRVDDAFAAYAGCKSTLVGWSATISPMMSASRPSGCARMVSSIISAACGATMARSLPSLAT
jgi:hypothetical protein